VQVRRTITKRIRRVGNGVDLVADVKADVSVNIKSDRSTRTVPTRPSSRGVAGVNDNGKESR